MLVITVDLLLYIELKPKYIRYYELYWKIFQIKFQCLQEGHILMLLIILHVGV